MALLSLSQGESTEADRRLKEVLGITERVFGRDDPNVVHNFGALHSRP
jgi:hypothetical protein